jgi:hypothetical protein
MLVTFTVMIVYSSMVVAVVVALMKIYSNPARKKI